MLERTFADSGTTLAVAMTGAEAIQRLRQQATDVLILDQALPDMSGLAVLRQVREIDTHVPVLVITAQGSTITAIEAMKWGAFDFLPKPLDLSHLQRQVARALEVRRLTRRPVELARGEAPQGPADLLLGNSRQMQDVWKTIGRAAAQDGPVLIEGEPGTGKELVARVLHLHGSHSGGPLAIVKCTDLGDPWLESELFGHEAGAVPGMSGARIGKVQQAAGGTLLIDEVGAASPALQSKLVRLLSERTYERLGGTESLPADVNLIATSTQPAATLSWLGSLRPDLYYLLGTFTIPLPPLRARKDDIPLLVDHFIKRFSHIGRTFDSAVTRASDEALLLLANYDWPGNVDELQSVIRRGLAETGGALVACDFLRRALNCPDASSEPPPASRSPQSPGFDDWPAFVSRQIAGGCQSLYADALDVMERQVLQAALDHTGGNQAQAAKILGITRGHLRKKIRQFGLSLGAGEAGEQLVPEPFESPAVRF